VSKKFILFVEGYTEESGLDKFLKRWLDARLDVPVGIDVVRFEGWSDLVRDAKKKANVYLTSPKQSEIIAVIGLIDLYGVTLYPDDISSVKERYNWLKKDIEDRVGQERYRQFFAVHETEAWFLAELDKLPPVVGKALKNKATHPERVNFDTPPAKLLQATFTRELRRDYKKVTEARNRFPKLDPELVAAKCPYLQQMLEELLKLAQEARQ
jgi:Domain of unknown function (DUF4276)